MPDNEADEKESPRTPKVVSGALRVQAESSVTFTAQRLMTINIDCKLPSALEWLENALDRMKAAPDCPKTITVAADRLEHEMDEAFRRRQVDEHWGWGHIKNTLTSLGLWERKKPAAAILMRRPKRIAPRSKKARGRG
jgi:hypothetical protein